MIKGCERKILLVNGGETSLFESAYFVLKKSAEQKEDSHTDMLKEANRIIESSLPFGITRMRRRERARRRLVRVGTFSLGALFGISACLVFFLIFAPI